MSKRDGAGRLRRRTNAAATAVLAAVALSLAACGSGGGKKAASTPAGAAGAGKPPVVLGAGNFTEQLILGQLYTQALAAKGYKVTLKQDIASSQAIHQALTSGQIDAYPEYTGKLLSTVARITAPQPSAQAAYDTAKAFEQRRGLTVLDATPFSNVDAVAVKPGYAKQHKLTEVGDLKRLGSVTIGGPREFETRLAGLAGVKRTYGAAGLMFKPLSFGLQYAALDKGQIQAANVFTTDARLGPGTYTVLADPKHVFGFGQVVPVVSQKVIAAEGPEFAQTINAVSAKLTTRAMQRLNAAVDIDKDLPAEAARAFLEDNGLR